MTLNSTADCSNNTTAYPPELLAMPICRDQREAISVVHLRFLDSLRALAALYVVAHHIWLQIWPIYLYHRSPHGSILMMTGWLQYGHYAVAMFIVLSGYCLMLPVERAGCVIKGGIKLFYWRRAMRILPPYYCALALSLLLIVLSIGRMTGTHWDYSLPITPGGLLTRLLLVNDIFPGKAGSINHAFWSIAVEWHIYFLFPLLVWSWKRAGALVTVAGAVLAGFTAMQRLGETAFAGVTPQFLSLFAFGMLAATICFNSKQMWETLRGGRFWLMLTVILFLFTIAVVRTHYKIYADYPFGLGCMFLLVFLYNNPPSRLRRFLEWRPLVLIGSFSYSIYLVHAPLIQIVWQYIIHPLRFGETVTFILLLGLGIPIIVAFSYGFYVICERPFLRRGSQRHLPS